MKQLIPTNTIFSDSICIEFPIVQFYLVYDDDSLCLESEKFESKDAILHCYNTIDNFYRWVFVESINNADWNLNKIMPPKSFIMPNTKVKRIK